MDHTQGTVFATKRDLYELEMTARGCAIPLDFDELRERPHLGPAAVEALERYALGGSLPHQEPPSHAAS